MAWRIIAIQIATTMVFLTRKSLAMVPSLIVIPTVMASLIVSMATTVTLALLGVTVTVMALVMKKSALRVTRTVKTVMVTERRIILMTLMTASIRPRVIQIPITMG